MKNPFYYLSSLLSIVWVCLLSNLVRWKIFVNMRNKTFEYAVLLALFLHFSQFHVESNFNSMVWNKETITNFLLIAPLLTSPTIKNTILARGPHRKQILNQIFAFSLVVFIAICFGIFALSTY